MELWKVVGKDIVDSFEVLQIMTKALAQKGDLSNMVHESNVNDFLDPINNMTEPNSHMNKQEYSMLFNCALGLFVQYCMLKSLNDNFWTN